MQKTWLTLLIAVFIVFAASALRELFFSEFGRGIPYLTYYPAVMIAAIIGGLPSGLLATTLSACLAYFWVQQGQMSSIEWMAMAFFIGICIMISLFARSMQKANERASQAEAIKESEKRLRMVFDNAIETIVVVQDEVVKYCNPMITELSGYSLEEVHSMNFSELIHPDDLGIVMKEYQARLSGELPKSSYSSRILTKDGLEKFVLINSTLIDWEGSPAALAMITDITQLEIAKSELKESEERFRQLMDQSPLAMEILALDGKIQLVNRAWKKLWDLGEPEAAETLEKYNMLTDPQIEKWGIMDMVKEAFQGKHIILPPIRYNAHETKEDYDFTFDKDVISPWIQCHLNPVRDAEGEIVYIVNTYVDITDLKNAWKNAQKSQERFQHLMEFTPLAISIWRPDGKNIQVNDAWKNLWGLSEEETAQVLEEYNFLNDEEIKRHGHASLIERAFKGEQIIVPPMEYVGNSTLEELELKDMEGSTRWIQVHLHSVKNYYGDVEYIVCTNTDLTELKQTERKVKEQREAFARIDRTSSMGQLTGSIAHELNQPLTGILSNAQAAELILKSKNWDLDEIKEIFAEIIGDTKRAGDVIHNLRELYSEQNAELLPVEINTVVQEAVKLLQSEFVVQNVDLTTKYDTSNPMVKGNKVQIQQVVVNLIMNGIQAMIDVDRNERNLWIAISCDANEVKVFVTDSGKGINPEIIDNIFEPLATWKPDGTGMGLAISDSIIKAHGGRMIAENSPEGGARVFFVLPGIKES